MSQESSGNQSQAQDNLIKDIHFDGDNTVFTFAPVQIGTKIETQIIQISVEKVTQKPLIKASPYKGLRRFNFGDRDQFFGRDHLIAKLFTAILRTKFEQVLSVKPLFGRRQDLIIKVRSRANFGKIARSWNCKP